MQYIQDFILTNLLTNELTSEANNKSLKTKIKASKSDLFIPVTKQFLPR